MQEERLKMHTANKVEKNIELIGKLFPNTLTETIKGTDINGKPIIQKAIDFDILRQELSNVLVEGLAERYQMNWPDKRKAIMLANQATDKTLRPCREESVDFDNTENLYIEGDNLEVLKLLQETYLNRVKMIYIDPPYNTGNDSFVYDDDFKMGREEFSEASEQYDEDGNMMFDLRTNSESNGRFHTDWLNMMYPRLKLAKDLLTEDGVIFISIDDKELDNLRKICNEIFGESNFVANIIWERSFAPINLKKHFSENHDFILCYAKSIENLFSKGLERSTEANDRYKNLDNDLRGPWQSDNLSVGPVIEEKVYEIITPGGRSVWPPNGRCWLYTKERLEEMIADNRIWFGEDGNNVPRVKRFLSEVKSTVTPMTIWKYVEVGHSQEAKQKLIKLFQGASYFDYPKSVELIERMLMLYTENDSIVMDFFSGSATTAEAMMQLNMKDGGKRKFILVQLPEVTGIKTQAYKDGYRTICEIGKERIRRAGQKIKEENPDKAKDLDTGFRVLKLDSSNMKDVYYTPGEYSQATLGMFEDNIKEDRSAEDLLFQVMLELDELLSSDIQEMTIAGKKVFNVAHGNIIACFDTGITEEVVIEIAKMQPYYAVFRDNCMASDSVATNFEQIFKTYSPSTIRKVL